MALGFDLRQLAYFVAVAETGSFRAAAERMHVSQPPLSRQIQDLERTLGARLLDRGPSGAAPTAQGRIALEQARAILRDAEALAGHFKSAARSGKAAPLRIGVTVAVAVAAQKRVASAWRKALPGLAFDVRPGLSRDLIPALKRGELDFALVGTPGDLTGLEAREVTSSPLVAAIPASHRLARARRVSLADVHDLPLFWIPRAYNRAYHDFCLRYFRSIGYRPSLIHVEPGQITTLERIAAGEGWTIPSGATIETRVKGVAYRPLAEGEALAIKVCGAWKGADPGGVREKLAAVALKTLRPAARKVTS